jgi:hypothetical protein
MIRGTVAAIRRGFGDRRLFLWLPLLNVSACVVDPDANATTIFCTASATHPMLGTLVGIGWLAVFSALPVGLVAIKIPVLRSLHFVLLVSWPVLAIVQAELLSAHLLFCDGL